MTEERRHWADDPYWTDALAALQRRRGKGLRFLSIDLDALDRVVFTGEGPAYRLLEAMVGVEREEGLDGHKGAPRVLLAALLRLAELSGTTGRIPRTKAAADDADGSG